MNTKINILDEQVINKIAAGEVVERPSSIIKELLENSIDAKSSKINIDVCNGGKTLIKISDNGIGIDKEDVEKAFLRHSTSKIKTIDDLYSIRSMGFRGEALSSIAAVSNITIVTKTKSQDVGIKMILKASILESKTEIGTTNGTSIIVEDLFFNTPARKKFLKSDSAENIAINEIINKIAIGNPNIKITYKNNNKVMLTTPGDGDLQNTIRSIYGKEVSENLISINSDISLMKISGFLGNNNIYRGNRSMEHFYINGRFVKSQFLYKILSVVYKSILPINKYPVCFLNIYIEPQNTDVNIHPSKLEVKFDKEEHIRTIMIELLKKQLITGSLIYEKKTYEPNVFIDSKKEIPQEFYVQNNSLDLIVEKIEEELLTIIDDKTTKEDYIDIADIKEVIVEDKKNYEIEDTNDLISEKYIETQLIYNENTKIKDSNSSNLEELHLFESKELLDINIIGSLFSTYIIGQDSNNMYLIDQHAAHERVMYESYMNKFKSEDIKTQILLEPHIMDFSSIDIEIVKVNLVLFKKMGFDIDFFGEKSIIIRGVPNLFGTPEVENFIYEVIDNINEEDSENLYSLRIDKIASLACKAAIKGNSKIRDEEIESLLRDLITCENPYTCPHGRPIIVTLSKKEIEKMFKRIV